MQDASMKIYLDDHLSGASTVTELVRRRVDRGEGPSWLPTFLDDLQEERDLLERLAAGFGTPSTAKQAMGWVVDKAASVKLMVDSSVDAPLRDLLEFEIIRTGIEGKKCLIRTLRHLTHDARVAEIDLDWWADRAEREGQQVEDARIEAVAAALAR